MFGRMKAAFTAAAMIWGGVNSAQAATFDGFLLMDTNGFGGESIASALGSSTLASVSFLFPNDGDEISFDYFDALVTSNNLLGVYVGDASVFAGGLAAFSATTDTVALGDVGFYIDSAVWLEYSGTSISLDQPFGIGSLTVSQPTNFQPGNPGPPAPLVTTPLPSAMVLMLGGIGVFWVVGRRKRRTYA